MVENLSWEDTARAMVASREDWGAWDAAAADGLGDLPWDGGSGRVAERPSRYPAGPRQRPRR